MAVTLKSCFCFWSPAIAHYQRTVLAHNYSVVPFPLWLKHHITPTQFHEAASLNNYRNTAPEMNTPSHPSGSHLSCSLTPHPLTYLLLFLPLPPAAATCHHHHYSQAITHSLLPVLFSYPCSTNIYPKLLAHSWRLPSPPLPSTVH